MEERPLRGQRRPPHLFNLSRAHQCQQSGNSRAAGAACFFPSAGGVRLPEIGKSVSSCNVPPASLKDILYMTIGLRSGSTGGTISRRPYSQGKTRAINSNRTRIFSVKRERDNRLLAPSAKTVVLQECARQLQSNRGNVRFIHNAAAASSD